MSEKPILFNGAMVRAILAGAKVQTRRMLKPQPNGNFLGVLKRPQGARWWFAAGPKDLISLEIRPRWSVGDHLWVRETWGFNPDHPSIPEFACYRADPGHEHDGIRWRPSIHMPRWASRTTLELTDVRVERLQDISEADAIAEGIVVLPGQDPADPSAWWESEPGRHQARTAVGAYRKLWDHINGAGAWDANPWVVALTFRRVA